MNNYQEEATPGPVPVAALSPVRTTMDGVRVSEVTRRHQPPGPGPRQGTTRDGGANAYRTDNKTKGQRGMIGRAGWVAHRKGRAIGCRIPGYRTDYSQHRHEPSELTSGSNNQSEVTHLT